MKTHFMQELHVNDAKHEDELVEHEIPELILKVLWTSKEVESISHALK